MLRPALGLLRIARPLSSTLICLSVALPIGLASFNWETATAFGAPTFLIAISAYSLNDLHDLERDNKNHPDRPLPRGDVSPRTVVVFFFGLLATALVLIEALLPDAAQFLFSVSIITAMSYSYVISHVPMLKNVYVATASILPLLVIREALGDLAPPLDLALPLFLFVAGIEMLSDIQDRAGDGRTVANRLGRVVTAILGFALKLAAASLLIALAVSTVHLVAAVLSLAFEVLLITLWVMGVRQALLIKAMSGQLVVAAAVRLYPS